MTDKKLSKKEINKIKEAFSLFDQEGSGTIKAREVSNFFSYLELKFTHPQVENILNSAGIDANSGLIYLDQALKMVAQFKFTVVS